MNALHFAYQASGNDETRRLLLLQAAAFLPLFRKAMKLRDDVQIDTLEKVDVKGTGAEAVEDIFATVSTDRMAAARKALASLNGALHLVSDARLRDAQLMATELVTNAILHGGDQQHPVRMEVRAGGPAARRTRAPGKTLLLAGTPCDRTFVLKACSQLAGTPVDEHLCRNLPWEHETTFLQALDTFDHVVAIGCLHHTGDMQRALDEVVHEGDGDIGEQQARDRLVDAAPLPQRACNGDPGAARDHGGDRHRELHEQRGCVGGGDPCRRPGQYL